MSEFLAGVIVGACAMGVWGCTYILWEYRRALRTKDTE